MTRTFIQTNEFVCRFKELKLTDDDLRALEDDLLHDPEAGDRMVGTGGLRKYRIPLEGRGKSGGARVCYFDIPNTNRLYLLTVYAKNEKDNLTKDERNKIKRIVKLLK